MKLLLGHSKLMYPHEKGEPALTKPSHEKISQAFVRELKKLDRITLRDRMQISDALASDVHKLYKSFDSLEPRAAISLYRGVVFQNMKPLSLPRESLQERLRIVSFLYGWLRPFDGIRPYRLEGYCRLDGLGDDTLYKFWRPLLTDRLLADMKSAKEKSIFFAGSEEIKRLFDWKVVTSKLKVIQPLFKFEQQGKPKKATIYIKMMRGASVRHIIEHGLSDTPADMKRLGKLLGASRTEFSDDELQVTFAFEL